MGGADPSQATSCNSQRALPGCCSLFIVLHVQPYKHWRILLSLLAQLRVAHKPAHTVKQLSVYMWAVALDMVETSFATCFQ
jgi:hypothetical protein